MDLKLAQTDIGGQLVKDDERYRLYDNTSLRHLVLSQTQLKPWQSTRGHQHAGQEEVYFFIQGTGRMLVGSQEFAVTSGDVILIPDGDFHRVINDTNAVLIFNCVFEGNRNH